MLFCLKLIFFLVYNGVWGLLCAISDTFPIVNCVYVCEISIFGQILFRPGGAAVSQRCGDVFGQTFFHQCNSYPSSALHTVQQQQQQLKKKKPAKIIRFTPILVNKLWYFENSLPLELLTLTFARDELMFSMFSMLPMQLFCTLLQARRMKSQKLRWPSNQLPAPITEENKMCTTIHFHTYWFHWCNCKEECFRLFYLFYL